MKSETIQIDKTGRVVLPKPVREHFNLVPGDKLKLSVEGNSIKLEPASAAAELVRKGSVLVFTGEFAEPLTAKKIEDLIARERQERLASASGKMRKR